MSDTEIQVDDLCARLASELSCDGNLQALLVRWLGPIVHASGARAGTVSVLAPEGDRMQVLGELALAAPGGAVAERVMVVPLIYRGLVQGEYTLRVPGEGAAGAAIVALHRTLGALLGMALANARLERASQHTSLHADRQAIAADVHDCIAQTLVFVKMRLPLLQEAVSAHDEASALRYCADVRQAIGTVHTNLRALLSEYRTPMDPRGLKHALRCSVESFQNMTQVPVLMEDRAPQLRLSAVQESQVFLIVQEALANIAKHAGARHAWVRIGQQADCVDVVVEDDGTGLPSATNPSSQSHFGVEIMRQRAERLGGGVEIAARSGGGTRLRLHFPVASAVDAVASA